MTRRRGDTFKFPLGKSAADAPASPFPIKTDRYGGLPRMTREYRLPSALSICASDVEMLRETFRRSTDALAAQMLDPNQALTNMAVPSDAMPTGEETLRQLADTLDQLRRYQVSIVVDANHVGEPVHYETEREGSVWFLSYADAQAVNREHPLELVRILSVWRAMFRPKTSLSSPLAVPLMPPPYQMPDPTPFREKR